MGLDDFDPKEDEQGAPLAGDDASASVDLDEDLFDFPVPANKIGLSAEEELADAIEAVEEIAASMLPVLDEPEDAIAGVEEPQPVTPEEFVPRAVEPKAAEAGSEIAEAVASPEPVVTAAADDAGIDDDLFGFEFVDSTPPARTDDLEENLDEVFGLETDVPVGFDDAIGDLLDAEDDLVREEAAQREGLAAPAQPKRERKNTEATPASAASAITPSAITPGEITPGGARVARARAALASLRGRFAGAPLLWLIGLMLSTNLLMLVIFWSSLGEVRDLVVETVHKVANSPAPAVLQRRSPLRETLERSTPTVQAAGPNEETLTALETLAQGQELITASEFTRARTGLFQLLARIDAVPIEDRAAIEAEANHLLGETYRGQADALSASLASTGGRR